MFLSMRICSATVVNSKKMSPNNTNNGTDDHWIKVYLFIHDVNISLLFRLWNS